jgi:hypothetical protein
MFNLDYASFTEEELRQWNRSERVDDDTPLIECGRGWVYDKSVFVSTITSKVKPTMPLSTAHNGTAK